MRSLRLMLVGAALLAGFGSIPVAWAAPGGDGHEEHAILVTQPGDGTSPGTLRWAIQLSNALSQAQRDAAPDTIVITAGAGIIKLDSLLPPVLGPVTITGPRDDREGTEAGIDGANFINMNDATIGCPPGPNTRRLGNPGFEVADTGNVQITHLTVQHFCIGILSLRSHDNTFTDDLLRNDIGPAGIDVTGDNGSGGVTVGTSVRNIVSHDTFVDDEDGADFIRGTSDSVIADNIIAQDDDAAAGLVPSQGIEFVGGGTDNNLIEDNRLTGGMSDGIQLNSGTGTVIRHNIITGDADAITVRGTDITIEDNLITGNHFGIGTESGATGVTITRNSIYGNAAPVSSCNAGGICSTDPGYSKEILGIDVGTDGVTPDSPAGTPAAAQNFPVLSAASAWDSGRVTLIGNLPATPSQTYTLEFYASRAANPSGYGEGQSYLGSVQVTTDPSGNALFTARLPVRDIFRNAGNAYFTATATSTATGSTSEFSQALPLTMSSDRLAAS